MIKSRSGFTIVELLIVIVVIAILAAITIVAYNGVQNRTNDTAVKSDLRNAFNQVEQYYAINGAYPTSTQQMSNISFKATKKSYSTSGGINYMYCTNTDGSTFGFIAKSTSGSSYSYTKRSGLESYATTTFPAGSGTNCPTIVPGWATGDYFLWGYNNNNWVSFIDG